MCDYAHIAFWEHFLQGLELMGHEHPSMRARSSSHANLHAISGLARNDLAPTYPAIDQVWYIRAYFPINLFFLVS